MQPLIWYKAFLGGMLGALLAFYLIHRNDKVAYFLRKPSRHPTAFFGDLALYLVCGGILTTFVGEPCDWRNAFISGCAWQGLASGLVMGVQMRNLKAQEHYRLGMVARGKR